jgi:hypothetical protein
MHLNPRGAKLPGRRQHLARVRLQVAHHKLRPRCKVTLHLRASARVVGITQPAAGAIARAAGEHVTLDANGKGALRVRVPAHGRLKVTVHQRGFRNGTVRLKVSRP